MKFMADECCDGDVVSVLRAEGHDVVYVPETMTGWPDDRILDHAYQTGRILISEDKDFGELVYRLKLPAKGVVLIRINAEDRAFKIPLLRKLIEHYHERLNGLFVTLEIDKFRARPLR